MADFTDTKDGPALHPIAAVDSNWTRLEPLLTPEKLRNTQLALLPLISGMADPVTKKRAVMTDEMLDGFIFEAVALAEAEAGLQIFPTQHRSKLAFDSHEFRSLGYFKIPNRPIAAIQSLNVVPANGLSVYQVPLDWIEVANLHMGQVNIIPINIANTGSGSFVPQQTAGGSFFLSILGSQPWIAAFWEFTYTTGFPDGAVPRLVNQYIGSIAAIEALSNLAATFSKSTSHSQSLDGVSQSISGPGPDLYTRRITDLQEKRKMLKGKLRAAYGLNLFSNNV